MLGVMLAFSLLPPLTYLARGDVAAVVEREMKRSGKMDQVPADKRAEIISMGAKAMKVALPVGAVVKRGAWIILAAALCFGLLRGTRPELKLAPVVGAVALAMAPSAVHDVLAALTYLVKDVSTIDAQNPVLSNPAAWLGIQTAHSVTGAALHGLDFFELWSCVLIAVGANAVAGTRSTMPWIVSFGGHALAMAAAVAGAAASS